MKISAEIIEYIDDDNYLIGIEGNCDYCNLKNNEVYCINCLMIRKCDLILWENIKNFIYSNINNCNLVEINNDNNDSDIDSEFIRDDSIAPKFNNNKK